MKKTVIFSLACMLFTGIAQEAFADMKEDAIKARRGYYQIVKLNAGVLVGMLKGDIEYDATKAQAAADNLVKLSTLDNSGFWVPGSSKEEMPGETRALKKIWDTFPAIGEKGKDYVMAIKGVAEVAGSGVDGLKKTVPAMGKACKACHDEYRADKF